MLVIITNLVVLSGVWFNRTGAPDAVVTLTERELPMLQVRDDDSGIALRLSRNIEDREKRSNEAWLDRAKLEKLGFDCPSADIDHNYFQDRKLFLVLDYREEDVQAQHGSRLFAIDAGQDPEELRRAYPDRGRYIIAPGVVQLRYRPDTPEGEVLGGRIRQLLPSLIHVPTAHNALFKRLSAQGLPDEPGDHPPRYGVTLRYGRRLEPWIVDVKPLHSAFE
jgi:hypothetical protein